MAPSLNRLGPYLLQNIISSVNGVITYAAMDTRQQHECLLYLLDPAQQPTAQQIDQFLQGARQAAQLRHAHIVAIRDFGQSDDCTFAASEALSATPLIRVLRQRRTFTGQEVCQLVQQVAAGLEHAAAQGCLHQALTPDVLWLTDSGKVMISGFGVLAIACAAPTITPFTAPEQLANDGLALAQADVYSLSAITYWLLLRQPPFPAVEPALLREQILHEAPAAPGSVQPALPKTLCAVLTFGLIKEIHARYTTPAEFARALQQAQERSSTMAFAAPPLGPSAALPRKSLARSLVTGWRRSNQFPHLKAGFHALAGQRWSRNLALIGTLVIMLLLSGILFINQSVDGARVAPVASLTTLPAVKVAVSTATIPLVPPTVATPSPASSATAAEAAVASSVLSVPITGAPLSTTPLTAPPQAELAPSPAAMIPEPQISRLVQALLGNVNTVVDWAALLPTGSAATQPDPPQTDEAAPPVATPGGDTPALRLIPAQAITLTNMISTPAISAAQVTPATPVLTTTTTSTVSQSVITTPVVSLHLPLVVKSIYIEGSVNEDANLRAGPSRDYPVLATAHRDQRIILVACNEDCSWFQLNSGEWIAGFLVSDVADPLNTLPVAIGH